MKKSIVLCLLLFCCLNNYGGGVCCKQSYILPQTRYTQPHIEKIEKKPISFAQPPYTNSCIQKFRNYTLALLISNSDKITDGSKGFNQYQTDCLKLAQRLSCHENTEKLFKTELIQVAQMIKTFRDGFSVDEITDYGKLKNNERDEIKELHEMIKTYRNNYGFSEVIDYDKLENSENKHYIDYNLLSRLTQSKSLPKLRVED